MFAEIFYNVFTQVEAFLIPSIPVISFILTFFDIIASGTFKIIILLCFVIFVLLPIAYKYSYSLQRSSVFLNFVNVPIKADYHHPENYGLKGAKNFYIMTNDSVRLGVWYIPPKNLENSSRLREQLNEDILDDGQNIMMYVHGNGGTRLSAHRVELYMVLRNYFHVITFDYRSYGDSTESPPSEADLVKDILSIYQWVRNQTKSNIFIWGHSLGTSLSTNALLHIQSMEIDNPVGLILEAPFNNMKEEVSEFPLAKLFKYLPWFHVTVVEPMSRNFRFETDKYICGVNIPIMILHAEDDRVVPYRLGYKLYEEAKKCRHVSQGKIIFYSFGGKHKYGHKFICRAGDLPNKINNFIQLALETKNDKDLQY